MICGLDDMKTTIVIFFILAFSSIIIYYLHERIQYLEHSVSRQNQVLSDFISNVQREVVHSSNLGISNSEIKVVKSDEMDKIVISDDDHDSDSDSEDDSDSDYDSDSEDDSDSDSEDDKERNHKDSQHIESQHKERNHIETQHIEINRIENNNKDIKVIELIDEEQDEDKESFLQEMNNDDLHISSSDKNVKKIDLTQKEENKNNSDDGDSDVVGSKKLSVAELRALVVSKGLANQVSANKMKKLELVDALNKL
jgi:hypothetical protein